MMNILLKNQWKMLMNTIRTQPMRNVLGFGVGILVIAFFLYHFAKYVWSMSSNITLGILENLLSFGFLVVIGMIILMGLPQVFKGLYSGSDLEMLFTMPVPTRHIFWIKYIQSYFGTPFFIFTIFTVPLIVYGVASQVSILYYIVALITLFTITVISLSIIFLLNLLLIQIIPPSRANELLTVMSFLAGIIVYLIFMLPSMASDRPIMELLAEGLPVLPKWIPVVWGSTAISQAVDGSIAAFVSLGMLILLASIMMILSTMLVEKGFRTGWIRLSEGPSKKKRNKKTGVSTQIHLNHPVIAIGKKEWFSIKRDLREWLTLMPVLFFIIFGLIGFISGGGSLEMVRGESHISWPIGQIVLLFIYAITNGPMSAYTIGREGPQLWVMQVMPISGKQIAYGKFWVSWLLSFIVVSLIEVVVAIFLGWTIFQFIAGLLIKGLITLGMSALGLWIGTLGAKYNPNNPQQRLNFGASIMLFVLSYLYLIIALLPVGYLLIPDVALADLPDDLNHGITGFIGLIATFVLKALWLKVSYPLLMSIVAVILMLLLTIGVSYLFLAWSGRRINQGLKIDMVSNTSSRSLGRRRL